MVKVEDQCTENEPEDDSICEIPIEHSNEIKIEPIDDHSYEDVTVKIEHDPSEHD